MNTAELHGKCCDKYFEVVVNEGRAQELIQKREEIQEEAFKNGREVKKQIGIIWHKNEKYYVHAVVKRLQGAKNGMIGYFLFEKGD